MGNGHTAWMPVYWRDVMAETAHFSPAQFGAYCLLIGTYWNSRGPFSADPERLRRIARMTPEEWAEAAPVLAELFQEREGRWFHPSLDDELAGAETRYQRRAAAGSKGGKAKGKHGASDAQASLTPGLSIVDPPPNQAQAQPQAHESPIGDSILETETKPKSPVNDELDLPDFLDRRSKQHGTRIPTDWSPGENGNTFAERLGLDRASISNISAQFKDYWHAKPGKDGTKADWDATWRNWVRKHIADNGCGPWPADGGRQSGGHRQSRAGVLAAVRSLMPQSQ